jgi:hypothetical protein
MGQMTSRQLTVVDALKAGSEEFTTMRQLAMRFRGLFRGGSLEKLDEWLCDATCTESETDPNFVQCDKLR